MTRSRCAVERAGGEALRRLFRAGGSATREHVLTAHVLAVLAAIGSAAPDGVRDARVAAYRRVPVALRGAVRTRVTRAVSDAIFATRHGGDEAHVHRLAYLAVLRVEAPTSDDLDAVSAAFEEARSAHRARERPSAARTAAVGLVLVVLPVALGAWWLWPRDPYAALNESLPASRGAYASGGRPDPGTDAERAIFAERVPAFTIALDRFRASRGGPDEAAARAAAEAEAARTVADAGRALSADTVSFLRAVLDQSIAVVASDESVGRYAAESHVRSVDALDAALQAEGLGYYVDAEVLSERSGRGRVYLSTFVVENVAIYTAGERTVRALRLRRLDRLNFARAVLGFTRPQVRDALVLMERIEEHLVQAIVPALAEDGAMPIADERDSSEILIGVGRVAAAGVREEAAVWMGGDGSRAYALGALLARRHAIFATWSERLLERGIVLREPDTYVIERAPYAALESALTPGERRDLDEVVEALADEAHQRTYRAIEARFVASIERHEVQHRLDFEMGTLGTLPPRLEALTGALRRGDYVNLLAERSNAETSAYLSELARDETLVRANLALLVRSLFDPHLWGTAECYAALVVVEGLAARLGIPHGALVAGHAIDRAEVARAHLALASRPDAEVREAAYALWAELYGRPLPELTTR